MLHSVTYLWPSYGIGQAHYIFILWFLLSIFLFFSSPILSRCRSDVYHTSTHGVALGCRSETCCMRLAGNTGCKKLPKIRHLSTITQLRRAISLQLRHVSTIGKKLVKQQYLPYMSPQLWPPFVIGGHYILPCSFYLLSIFFFFLA